MTPELPRLSPSIAKIMVERSPLHAWQAHRLLGGGDGSDSSDAQNVGKVLEALVFNQSIDKTFAILDFKDYKTKAAQNEKASALRLNKTPILKRELEVHIAAGVIIKRRLADQGIVFEGGEYQKRVEWTCSSTRADGKGFIDYYIPGLIWDLKCVSDASPRKVQRSFVDYGWDIQHAAYLDAIETLEPKLAGRVQMLYAFAETDPPYAVHIYEPDGMMKDLGANKWDYAKKTWVECLESNHWPGYFEGVHKIAPLPWQMTVMEEL